MHAFHILGRGLYRHFQGGYLGMPECNVHLAHCAVYLSLAPKSNEMENAYFAARDDARATLDQPVPLHLRNAETRLLLRAYSCFMACICAIRRRTAASDP